MNKKFISNSILFGVSCFLSLVLLESGLRYFSSLPSLGKELIFDARFGFWRKPHFNISRPFYSTHSFKQHTTNLWGMMDQERSLQPKPSQIRVAILGDSYMEAAAVPDGFRFHEQIEKRLRNRFEVLNFGMNNTGTIQQLAIYRYKVQAFKPNIVICAFLPLNDVANNDLVLDKSLGNKALDYWIQAELDADSNIVLKKPIHPVAPTVSYWQAWAQNWMPATYFHLSLLKNKFTGLYSTQANLGETQPSYFEVYHAPNLIIWKRAWKKTEGAILALKKEVEANGSQFILLLLSDPLASYPNPKTTLWNEFKWKAPTDFDVTYPTQRLTQFAQSHQIPCINLDPVFRQYQQIHQLKFPYFSFPTDGHWDTLGYQVAADTVASFLNANQHK